MSAPIATLASLAGSVIKQQGKVRTEQELLQLQTQAAGVEAMQALQQAKAEADAEAQQGAAQAGREKANAARDAQKSIDQGLPSAPNNSALATRPIAALGSQTSVDAANGITGGQNVQVHQGAVSRALDNGVGDAVTGFQQSSGIGTQPGQPAPQAPGTIGGKVGNAVGSQFSPDVSTDEARVNYQDQQINFGGGVFQAVAGALTATGIMKGTMPMKSVTFLTPQEQQRERLATLSAKTTLATQARNLILGDGPLLQQVGPGNIPEITKLLTGGQDGPDYQGLAGFIATKGNTLPIVKQNQMIEEISSLGYLTAEADLNQKLASIRASDASVRASQASIGLDNQRFKHEKEVFEKTFGLSEDRFKHEVEIDFGKLGLEERGADLRDRAFDHTVVTDRVQNALNERRVAVEERGADVRDEQLELQRIGVEQDQQKIDLAKAQEARLGAESFVDTNAKLYKLGKDIDQAVQNESRFWVRSRGNPLIKTPPTITFDMNKMITAAINNGEDISTATFGALTMHYVDATNRLMVGTEGELVADNLEQTVQVQGPGESLEEAHALLNGFRPPPVGGEVGMDMFQAQIAETQDKLAKMGVGTVVRAIPVSQGPDGSIQMRPDLIGVDPQIVEQEAIGAYLATDYYFDGITNTNLKSAWVNVFNEFKSRDATAAFASLVELDKNGEVVRDIAGRPITPSLNFRTMHMANPTPGSNGRPAILPLDAIGKFSGPTVDAAWLSNLPVSDQVSILKERGDVESLQRAQALVQNQIDNAGLFDFEERSRLFGPRQLLGQDINKKLTEARSKQKLIAESEAKQREDEVLRIVEAARGR